MTERKHFMHTSLSLSSMQKSKKLFLSSIHMKNVHTKPKSWSYVNSSKQISPWPYFRNSFLTVGGIILSGFAAKKIFKDSLQIYAKSDEIEDLNSKNQDATLKTSDSYQNKTSNIYELNITFYNYQGCPSCCKTRAFLDYNGFSYDLIEVNMISKNQINWSQEKDLPLLVVQQSGSQKQIVLYDSSLIISLLESFVQDRSSKIEILKSYYPIFGNDIKNKYFVMLQDKKDLNPNDGKHKKEERHRRKWVDQQFVHVLEENVYSTPSEAIETFKWFSVTGQWENLYSSVEMPAMIYIGAIIEYVSQKFFKNFFLKFKSSKRDLLYQACNEWVKAIGKGRDFMGGSKPNLADLAVYGVLNPYEGCQAFHDATFTTDIGPWYKRTKAAVWNHEGLVRNQE